MSKVRLSNDRDSYTNFSCAKRGDADMCRVLLDAGVDPTIASLQGATAVQLTADERTKAVLTAKDSPPIAPTDWKSLESQLLDASKSGDLEVVQVGDGHVHLYYKHLSPIFLGEERRRTHLFSTIVSIPKCDVRIKFRSYDKNEFSSYTPTTCDNHFRLVPPFPYSQ